MSQNALKEQDIEPAAIESRCQTRIVDRLGLQPPFVCGQPAIERVLFMCVHEHRREGFWCASCTQVQTGEGFYCIACVDGPRSHECPLRLVGTTRIGVS